MDDRLKAAKTAFPFRTRAIEDLAARDEDFFTLCIDLADAESSAEKWKDPNSPKGVRYRAEYLDLANDLAKEIEAALNQASIIPLHHPRSR